MTTRRLVGLLILLCPLLLSQHAYPQTTWVAGGVPFLTTQVFGIYTDTIGNAIYFCGASSIDGDNNFNDQGISVYSDGQWDTIGVFTGTPLCAIRWQDTLLVGGSFLRINEDSIPACAAFANGTWSQYGDFPNSGGPAAFRIINGELFAIGAFQYVDGHLCKGLAKRVGDAWLPVGDMSEFSNVDPIVSDLVAYQGDLVIAGAGLNIPGSPGHGVAIYDGDHWAILGSGIEGNFGVGLCLAVYHDELYVGGGIHVAEGNAGEGIVKWTGSTFAPVGTGLQNANNQWALNVGASEFKVHNDLLYMTGQIWHAGNVPAYGIATWDGYQYCGLGGAPAMPTDQFDFYHDTLYVGTFHTADGAPVNCVAKYVGSYPDTCSAINTSLADLQPILDQLRIRYLDGTHIAISGPMHGVQRLLIHDASGRLVRSGTVDLGPAGSGPISIEELLPGLYLIECLGQYARFTKH